MKKTILICVLSFLVGFSITRFAFAEPKEPVPIGYLLIVHADGDELIEIYNYRSTYCGIIAHDMNGRKIYTTVGTIYEYPRD